MRRCLCLFPKAWPGHGGEELPIVIALVAPRSIAVGHLSDRICEISVSQNSIESVDNELAACRPAYDPQNQDCVVLAP
jgi:hypothetical protein